MAQEKQQSQGIEIKIIKFDGFDFSEEAKTIQELERKGWKHYFVSPMYGTLRQLYFRKN